MRQLVYYLMIINILFSVPVYGEVNKSYCSLDHELCHDTRLTEYFAQNWDYSTAENSSSFDTFYISLLICPGPVTLNIYANGVNHYIEANFPEEGVYEFIIARVDDSPIIVIVTVSFLEHTVVTYHLATICEGESVSYYGQSYSTSGQYYLNPYQGIHCDSIELLTLTVHDTFYTETYATICQGEEYHFQGHVFSEEGSYPVIYPHPLTGCDSTYMLHLTVNPAYADTITTSICAGEFYDFHGDIISNSGTYNKDFQTNLGCDSLFTLHLTVNPTAETNLNESICDGEEYHVGFSTYTTTGSYSDTLWTTLGCDSVVNLNLTVFPLFETILNEEICDGDSYTVGSIVYTTSGTFTDIMPDVNGCDSTVILHLVVHPLFETVLNVEICDGDTYMAGPNAYTVSGTYTNIFPDIHGCDSTVTLNLTVHPLLETVLHEEICDGDSYTVGTNVYTTSGTYTDILPDVNGCDSTVILNLTVHPLFETILNVEICEGDSYTVGSSVYSTSGTYTNILPDVNGCDSTIILNLIVHPVSLSGQLVQICEGETYTIGTSTYSSTGYYYDVLIDVNGCDSAIVTILTVHPLHETILLEQICDGETYSVGTSTYSTSGTYTDILQDQHGCDSTVILNLTVHPLFETVLNEEICDGDSYTVGTSVYTTSGTYTDILPDMNGCDSTVILNLTVHSLFETVLNEEICDGESYTVGTSIYTTSGTYTDILPDLNGCDSTVILNLTVHPLFETVLNEEICDGESYTVGTSVYTTSGTYTDILPDVNGCDSTVILNLTVHPLFEIVLNEEICDGDSYTVGTSVYTTSGTYTDILPDVNGCDSTVILNLTVHPLFETVLNEEICDGESYTVGTSIYTTSGTYTDILPDVNGCDSTVILNLTVHPLFETVLNEEICDGDSYTVGSSIYITSGTYTDILPDVNGCDSTVILNLTVHPLFETVLNEEICDGDSYTVGTSVYTTSGTYTDILPDVNGCDSTVILNLTVHPLFETVLNEEICDGDSYTVGTSVYTTSGTYTDILPDVNGCDSTVILNLTVHPLFETVLNEEICDGDSYTIGTSIYTTSGTYTDVLPDLNGCDSTVILNLIVHPLFETVLNEEICDGDSYTVGTSVYTTSGTYTDILPDVNGCDSTVILNLTVHPLFETVLNEEICDGDSYTVGSSIYTTSGTYTDILPDMNGCDSTVILTLTVHPLFETVLNEVICDGDSYSVGSSVYTTSGTYTDILPDVNGCDSTVILNLTVHPLFETVLNEEICDGDSYTVGSSVYTTSGTYTEILPDVNGCDSTVILNLIVLDGTSQEVFIGICQGGFYELNGVEYTENGVYEIFVMNEDSCFSEVTLHLTVFELSQVEWHDTICSGESIQIGIHTFSQSGNFTVILEDTNGCDSTIFLNLTVLELSTTYISTSICEGQVYEYNNSTYSHSGNYTIFLQDQFGCDSTIILQLQVIEHSDTTLIFSICEGDSILINGQSYNSNGSFEQLIVNASGCDSLIIIHIEIIPNSHLFIHDTICEGEVFEMGGFQFSNTGTYEFELDNGQGCATSITLHLEVLPVDTTLLQLSICQGDSVSIGGQQFYSSGNFEILLQQENGCDSLIILNLTVLSGGAQEIQDSICQGEIYELGGMQFTSTGTYEFELDNGQGCATSITLHLEVLPVDTTLLQLSICQGDSVSIGGQQFYSSGNFEILLQQENGCDSLNILNLTVLSGGAQEIQDSICQGEIYELGGMQFTSTGTYEFELDNGQGCATSITLHLEVLPVDTTLLQLSICQGDSVSIGGQQFYSSGNFEILLQQENGCDSLIILNLTVLSGGAQEIQDSICQGEIYELGGMQFTSTGTYEFELDNGQGCATSVTLHLEVLPVDTTLLQLSICQGDSISIGGQQFYSSGNFEILLQQENGCDSLIILYLLVYSGGNQEIYDTICHGEIYNLAGFEFDSTGSYEVVLGGLENCETTVTLILEVVQTIETNRQVTLCSGDSLTIHNQILTEPGIYTFIFESSIGCDSVEILEIILHESGVQELHYELCEGNILNLYNLEFENSGIYTIHHVNQEGCLDTTILHLSIIPTSFTHLHVDICTNSEYFIGDTSFYHTGIYIINFSGQNGCDSIIHLHLNVNDYITYQTEAVICAGETYSFFGEEFSESGTYDFIVPGNNNCDTIYLLELNVINNSHETIQGKDFICNGGSLTLSGPQGYSFVWNTGSTYNNISIFGPGEYSLTITDNHSCETVLYKSVALIEFPEITDIQTDDPGDCKAANGSFKIIHPFNEHFLFSINNGLNWQSTPVFNDLATGIYQLYVAWRDQICVIMNPLSIEIVSSGNHSITEVNVKPDSRCNDFGGTIDVSGSGFPDGTLYSIDNGQTWAASFVFPNLKAGEYMLQIKPPDCESTLDSVVNVPLSENLIVNYSIIKEPVCWDSEDAEILLSINNAGDNLQINWSNGWNTYGHISGLSEGIYSITVSDNFGCEEEISFELKSDPFDIPEQIFKDTAICKGEIIYFRTLESTLLYSWQIDNVIEEYFQSSFYVSKGGLYSVDVFNYSGCIKSRSFLVHEINLDNHYINFLLSDTGYVNESIVAVEISEDPPQLEWIINDESIIEQAILENQASLLFSKEGQFKIGLMATLDGCKFLKEKNILILPEREPVESGNSNYFTDIELFRLFPNPNNGNFSVEIRLSQAANLVLSITDIMGTEHNQRYLFGKSHYLETFENVQLPPGVYNMTLQLNGRNHRITFIIY